MSPVGSLLEHAIVSVDAQAYTVNTVAQTFDS